VKIFNNISVFLCHITNKTFKALSVTAHSHVGITGAVCNYSECTNVDWGLVTWHEHKLFLNILYLLTYSMVQSPSWEANWFAASQEIPRILRNPKVHYRTHKRPPTVSILGQPNSVHIPTSHLLEIRPNIIHPFTPRYPQWSLSLRFPHQDPIHPPHLTYKLHMPNPLYVVFFYLSENKQRFVPLTP